MRHGTSMASIRQSLFRCMPISPYGGDILPAKLAKSKNRDFGPQNQKYAILGSFGPPTTPNPNHKEIWARSRTGIDVFER